LRLSLTPWKFEVETGDSGPGVPGPSHLVTEGSGELVPDIVASHSFIADVAGAILSHPDTAGLMGATLRAPIASSSQMLGSIGAADNPDVHADVEIECNLTLEAGSEARPAQPPHPPLVVYMPSGYPEDLGTFGKPDMVDIADMYCDFSVDVTPLASSVDVTSCPGMSVDLGASLSVDAGAYAETSSSSQIQNPSQ